MKPSGFYKQTLKRFGTMRMKEQTRSIAHAELRRAIALVEWLMPGRRTPARLH